MTCRFSGAADLMPFVDLGTAPPSNALLSAANLTQPEPRYPLRVNFCLKCWLAQTEDFVRRESLFTADYHYSSSTSRLWLAHCAHFVKTAVAHFGLGAESLVAEIAANDGYLLQYVREAGVPCYGVEPTRRAAEIARRKGLRIIEEFFGRALGARLAQDNLQADLLIANNVLAHVPDINDFVGGVALVLKPRGVESFEFPHLLRLVEETQFDTIYHEHYSYLSLAAVNRIVTVHGLRIFDVETLATHGGSLRVFAGRADSGHPVTPAVKHLHDVEARAGVETKAFYGSLQRRAEDIRDALVSFLAEKKTRGEVVAGYGAAAKGNTLLNFAGVGADHIAYIVDQDPGKQGKFTPGGHIPIVAPEHLRRQRPQWVLILPWNIKDEIVAEASDVRTWGARFVTAIPELRAA